MRSFVDQFVALLSPLL